MKLNIEINKEIINNCDSLLAILKECSSGNDSPEGRMVFQCKWLKERAASGSLVFPVQNDIDTLKNIYSERYLQYLASKPEKYHLEVEVFLYRLLNLLEGKLVIRPSDYADVIELIDELSQLLKNSERALGEYEIGLIAELSELRYSLAMGKIEPPLIYYLPDYPNFRKVYSLAGISIADLKNGAVLLKRIADAIFEGVRSNH